VVILDWLNLTLGPLPWLLLGLGLLGISLMAPNPITVSLGCAGLVTALIALSIPVLSKQLLVWAILSVAFTLILRGLVPRNSKALAPNRYARVLEVIPPGGIGRVSYDGGSWQARSQISDGAIAPEATVTVVSRQGNMLIVSPVPTAEGNF
jgi:membrane protein implicated in regulation of membrane protease activity